MLEETTQDPAFTDPGAPTEDPKIETPDATKAHVKQIIETIQADKLHHKDAFERMRRDQHVAMHGAEKDWSNAKYKANISGRHVKQRTAALYAKNPRVKATRPETLDFAVWDESVESLQLAIAAVTQAMAAPPLLDALGQPVVDPAVQQAQAIVQDFQAGMARRNQLDKVSKTLEILFNRAMKEQKPLPFKMSLKGVVRRALVNSVGYVELAFQREKGPRPTTASKMADHQERIDHLERLVKEASDGDIEQTSAELAELQAAAASLAAEPEIVLREGLVFDFPQSTKVIPDRKCKSLAGFVGAGHLTIEYDYTPKEILEMFKVDITKDNEGYSPSTKIDASAMKVVDDKEVSAVPEKDKKNQPRKVWKMYDKVAGLVYYVADGYCNFLRPPAAPDVFVEDFWPVYALVFNEVENEDELFPQSDVSLMLDMQREKNRSRQGKREHRDAARPRWVSPNGAMEQGDIDALARSEPFTTTKVNLQPGQKIEDALQAVPVPGVDPNLYDTGEVSEDMQQVVGAQEAKFGGVTKATATESAIAEGSTTETDSSNIDDLDDFLTMIARGSGQIFLREMSPEIVTQIVGPGAVWPEASLADIANEVFLEIEAGSTGKPNQATEIRNWKEMLPFLIQMPDITPGFLAKETLRRLDDKMDFTKAISQGALSIAASNMSASAMPVTGPAEDPANEPAAQGGAGANNAPVAHDGPGGSGPAFGSNQVT